VIASRAPRSWRLSALTGSTKKARPEQSNDATRVEVGFQTHPLNLADQIRSFGLRRHVKRRLPRSMKRLRDILEGSPTASKGERATVGGMDSNYVPNP
jgi:hypothetical protein